MRSGGYHAVSFRDLAADVGIKSASVHYHFPQKEHLGRALVARYAERFAQILADTCADSSNYRARVRAICEAYERALTSGGAVCLCGLLGSEAAGLPQAVVLEVSAFFHAQTHWLAVGSFPDAPTHSPVDAQCTNAAALARARVLIATLQGAMMMAVVARDPQQFAVTMQAALE